MSETNETNTVDPQTATLEAFKRLGIEVDPAGDADTGKFLEQLGAVGDKLEQQAKQIEDLTAEVETHKKVAAKAKAAAKASAGAKPAKARTIGAKAVDAKLLEPKDDEADKSPAEILLARIAAAETVEIAFSDGKSELLDCPPVAIEGDAWRAGVVGVQLTVPQILLHGPGEGRRPIQLAGYGLLLDGKLAAYRDRGDVLTIAGGSRHNVAPDIVF